MKINFLIIALLLSSFALAQEPVKWDITAVKKGTFYELKVTGQILKDWYVYAETNEDDGLEALHVKWDNENVISKDNPVFATSVNSVTDPIFSKNLKVYKDDISFTQGIEIKGKVPQLLKIIVVGFASDGKEFLPIEETIAVPFGGEEQSSNIKLKSVDLKNPVSQCGDQQGNAEKSLLAIFFLGVAGGLLALLTPCVFPMIPVTVSYFTSMGKTKSQGITNGILYGLSILLIYVLASIPFHLMGNIDPQIFNTISTNVTVNIIFFLIFILFALSFFGIINIKLPSALANNAGSKGGIFFMALTLAIVSFSCTGPILGSLLVGTLSSEGGAWQLTAGMCGFGIALAFPFALFAMFPNWLKTLPKSGGWMEVVKKSLAFVELALAVKFLSNADLVKHWGILKREVFIGLWIIIAIGLALYLFGIFDKKYTIQVAKERNRLNGRNFIGAAVMLFALYLIPGVTKSEYANLTLLSGFPPPLSYSIYGKNNIIGKGLEPAAINDYEKALQMSKEQNKPLLIDFTGWACVNCRKMEEQVWTKPDIKKLISENYILVSLYVDDRKRLPADQQVTYKDKDIRTVGDKWATFQQENFNQVTQPLYVVLSPDEKLMNHPVGYTSADEYKKWLECGIEAFKK